MEKTMNEPLGALFDSFVKERRYLKAVTPKTETWCLTAFKAFQATPGAGYFCWAFSTRNRRWRTLESCWLTARMLRCRECRNTPSLRPAKSEPRSERTKKRIRYDHAVPLRSCTVSFTAPSGTRHSTEVQAESVYEAAAVGLAILRKDGWTPSAAGGTRIEVEIREPVTKHELSVMQIERWLNGATRPARCRTPAIC
jgi:hypothetical protein